MNAQPFQTEAVFVQETEDGFLVFHKNNAWLHATFSAALKEAQEIAKGFGIAVFSEINDDRSLQ